MPGGLDLAPGPADDAWGVDKEGDALHADELAAVELLRQDHVEGLAPRLVRVAGQLEADALLVAEFAVRVQRVARGADDGRAELAELRQQRVEAGALGGAAGRAVLRVEVHHQPAP